VGATLWLHRYEEDEELGAYIIAPVDEVVVG